MIGRYLAGLASPVAIFMPFAALAAPVEGYEGYGHHMMWGGGWFGWIFGPLMMVLVIGGIIALVVVLMRNLGGSAHPTTAHPARPDPLDILKERYARGEIDHDEYEKRRQVLGG